LIRGTRRDLIFSSLSSNVKRWKYLKKIESWSYLQFVDWDTCPFPSFVRSWSVHVFTSQNKSKAKKLFLDFETLFNWVSVQKVIREIRLLAIFFCLFVVSEHFCTCLWYFLNRELNFRMFKSKLKIIEPNGNIQTCTITVKQCYNTLNKVVKIC